MAESSSSKSGGKVGNGEALDETGGGVAGEGCFALRVKSGSYLAAGFEGLFICNEDIGWSLSTELCLPKSMRGFLLGRSRSGEGDSMPPRFVEAAVMTKNGIKYI